jgi:hypothetical protein
MPTVGIITIFLKFWETFPNSQNIWETLGNVGKCWEMLGNVGNIWERDLGDISASDETMTELRGFILTTDQGTSRPDVH